MVKVALSRSQQTLQEVGFWDGPRVVFFWIGLILCGRWSRRGGSLPLTTGDPGQALSRAGRL